MLQLLKLTNVLLQINVSSSYCCISIFSSDVFQWDSVTLVSVVNLCPGFEVVSCHAELFSAASHV